jgi:hypothetical protein
MKRDDIIDLRLELTAIEPKDRSIMQNNVLRDCDIALRVVRVEDRVALEAEDRIARFIDELDDRPPCS